MNKKNSARFVIIFMACLVLVSIVMAWMMSQNYSKDTSKLRSQLTQAHKEALDKEFVYSPERGRQVYNQFCLRCHGAEGQGTLSAPPLAGSELVVAEASVPLRIVYQGMSGKIERAGKIYDLVMPGFPMITHEDLAHVLSFIRSSFGNQADVITTEEVIRLKVDNVERQMPWTEGELKGAVK